MEEEHLWVEIFSKFTPFRENPCGMISLQKLGATLKR